MNKIYISEKDGSVYWLVEDSIMQAPISTDGTCNFDEAAEVEHWEESEGHEMEAEVRAKLA